MFKSYAEILEKARSGDARPIAVADAAGESVLEALKEAAEMGIVLPLLVGNPDKIDKLAKAQGLTRYEIIAADGAQTIAEKTVELVKEGKAGMMMKGKVPTPTLLKAVLDKEKGLRKGKLLSHVAAMEVKGYPKLMLVTDGGMVIRPTLEQKVDILANAETVAKGLGIEKPKVAVLAAIETINPDMPETLDAAYLVKMSERGQLGDLIVDGPLAMDCVLSKTSAKLKGIDTIMSEDADILLFPDIASGNISVKALIYLAGAKVGGLVVGATAPIVLLSRSDTAEIKLISIALASVLNQ